jgi:hypothetical protein
MTCGTPDITKLGESQASDQTIMSIAGHLSRKMLEQLQPYSYARKADGPRRHREARF